MPTPEPNMVVFESSTTVHSMSIKLTDINNMPDNTGLDESFTSPVLDLDDSYVFNSNLASTPRASPKCSSSFAGASGSPPIEPSLIPLPQSEPSTPAVVDCVPIASPCLQETIQGRCETPAKFAQTSTPDASPVLPLPHIDSVGPSSTSRSPLRGLCISFEAVSRDDLCSLSIVHSGILYLFVPAIARC